MPNFKGLVLQMLMKLLFGHRNLRNQDILLITTLKCLNDDLQMRSNWELPICNGSERLKRNGKKVHSTQKPEVFFTEFY